MHGVLRLSAGLIIAVAIGVPSAHADDTQNLVVTLDVPPDRAPGRVCVLTPYNECNGHKPHCPTPISLLGLEPQAGDSWLFPAKRAAPLAANVAKEVAAVADLLGSRRGEITERCDATNQMCAPAITLRAHDANTQITCSRGDGSSNPRVAFLSLQFAASDTDQPGVIEVTLKGTTATLAFASKLDRKIRTVVQVIGGDYAPQPTSSMGFDETMTVKLAPRCRRVIAEIPGFPAGTYGVTVTTDDPDLAVHNGTCRGTVAQEALSVYLPFTTDSEVKTIAAQLLARKDAPECSHAVTPAIEATASWSTDLPAAPFRLAAHSFEMAWTKPSGCEAEKWQNPPDWPSIEAEWSIDCPRASLPDGTACKLDKDLPDRCNYACTVTSPSAALAFPTTIRFDRLRLQEGADETPVPEQVYTWTDTLLYSGQVLHSQVAPADRRIMLEYANREKWRPRFGVEYDEVRIVSPDGFTRSQLFKQDLPPRWEALNIPGACTTHVAVAVFGTALYDEHPELVVKGVVTLRSPQIYRKRNRLDLELGGTYQTQNALGDGQVGTGAGAVWTFEPRWPFALGAFASVNFTKKSYVDDVPGPSDGEQIAIWRVEFGPTFEYWFFRRVHAMARAGIQLDSPLHYDDDAKMGKLKTSVPTELGVVLEIVRRHAWLVFGVGLDFDVEHNHVEIDAQGARTTTEESRTEPFFFLRLRSRLR